MIKNQRDQIRELESEKFAYLTRTQKQDSAEKSTSIATIMQATRISNHNFGMAAVTPAAQVTFASFGTNFKRDQSSDNLLLTIAEELWY